MPTDDLTPGAGPFPATPGIAPSTPPGGWLNYWLNPFVWNPAPAFRAGEAVGEKATGAIESGVGAAAGKAGAEAVQGAGNIASSAAGAFADRLGLPAGGVRWQSFGVYLALFILLAIGVTSLLLAAKER